MGPSDPIPPFRADLGVEPADPEGGRYAVRDPYRVAPPLELSSAALWLAARFDGVLTATGLARRFILESGAELDPQAVADLADSLDDAHCLESSALDAFVSQPVRPPVCLNSYPEDPAACEAVVGGLFAESGVPGPRGCRIAADGPARAVLAPHMDYGRGGPCYGWAFKEFWERTASETVVVVATSHLSPHRATLSRQHFWTPFGVLENASEVTERIGERIGPEAWADRLAHCCEHSIELEAVILQWLARRDGAKLRIVPLLVGGFHDCVRAGVCPSEAGDIAGIVEALRGESGSAFLVSGDLAHIGPKFGDRPKIDDATLDASRAADRLILDGIETGDPAAYRKPVWAERDRRRICGMPPTWLTLAALRPGRGKVLDYRQARDPLGRESVSFAAAAWG